MAGSDREGLRLLARLFTARVELQYVEPRGMLEMSMALKVRQEYSSLPFD